MHKTGAIN